MAKQPTIHPTTSLELQDFILITPENRKKAVVIGRIFYLIKIEKYKNVLDGTYLICPLRKKGWVKTPWFPWDFEHPYIKDIVKQDPNKKHWSYYCEEDENYNQWALRNKQWLDKWISQGILYMKTTDPILTFK